MICLLPGDDLLPNQLFQTNSTVEKGAFVLRICKNPLLASAASDRQKKIVEIPPRAVCFALSCISADVVGKAGLTLPWKIHQ